MCQDFACTKYPHAGLRPQPRTPANADRHDLDLFDFGGLCNEDIEETRPAIIEGPCTGLPVNRHDPNLKNVSCKNEVLLCDHLIQRLTSVSILAHEGQIKRQRCTPRWTAGHAQGESIIFLQSLNLCFFISQPNWRQWTWQSSRVHTTDRNTSTLIHWLDYSPTSPSNALMMHAGPIYFFQCWPMPSIFPPSHLLIGHGVPAIFSKLFRKSLISPSQMFHTHCARRIVSWRWYVPFGPYHANSHRFSLEGLWPNEDSEVKACHSNLDPREGVFRWCWVQELTGED